MTARPRASAAGGDRGDLPDVNVWLALAVQEHPHHAAARQYWANGAAARLHFCRVTMLGLVRLLTQPRLMGPAALDATGALAHYDRFAALPEVGLAAEPANTSAALRRYMGAALPARLITDQPRRASPSLQPWGERRCGDISKASPCHMQAGTVYCICVCDT